MNTSTTIHHEAQHEAHRQPLGEAQTTTPTPRIYVACLAAHNAGILHGAWFEAGQDPDDLQAQVAQMLEASPVPTSGESAIHDYEGFPGVRLHEHESLTHVATVAQLLAQHGEVFGRLYGYLADLDLARRYIDDSFRGCWESIEAWAESYLDDVGALAKVPDIMRPYLSMEAYARDCIASGDILCLSVGRQIAVFFND